MKAGVIVNKENYKFGAKVKIGPDFKEYSTHYDKFVDVVGVICGKYETYEDVAVVKWPDELEKSLNIRPGSLVARIGYHHKYELIFAENDDLVSDLESSFQ